MAQEHTYKSIYRCVNSIPKGKVASYGQIAFLSLASGPRQVGYALAANKEEAVCWHRVINAKGKISFPEGSSRWQRQRKLLEKEGVVFNEKGVIDLSVFGWRPN